MAKTIDPSWAKRNGALVQPGEPRPKNGGEGDFSYENILPWLMAGGLGLIGHSVAAPFFDDDENKKQSVWRKLLGTLIPLGVGGLGAYGGYALGKALLEKNGADGKQEGPTIENAAALEASPYDTVEFDWGTGRKRLRNDQAAQLDRTQAWGEAHGMDPCTSSPKDMAEEWVSYNFPRKWAARFGSYGGYGAGAVLTGKGILNTPWVKVVGGLKNGTTAPVPVPAPRPAGWWNAVKGTAANVGRKAVWGARDIARRGINSAKEITEKSRGDFKKALLATLIGYVSDGYADEKELEDYDSGKFIKAYSNANPGE